MPCYPCSHCNKCGIFSLRLGLRCSSCGEPIPAGSKVCASCGKPFLHNMKRGKIGKPEGSHDYYSTRYDPPNADLVGQ